MPQPTGDPIATNRVFHDHECAYYDQRFAIVHDSRAAAQAVSEVERLLGSALVDGTVVLDVGCGTGWLAAGLRRGRPDVRTVGLDLSAGMLGRARAAGAWPLVQGDAGRLPLPEGSVDLVVGRGVLHHLPRWRSVLGEWRRVCRPGGAVVLTSEPTATVERHGSVLVRCLLPVLRRALSREDDFWEVASMAANLHTFDPAEIEDAGRNAGFGDVTVSTASFASTLLLTTSYVTHGRRPRLAAALPWRAADEVARVVDRLACDRLLPSSSRHVVRAVLRVDGGVA